MGSSVLPEPFQVAWLAYAAEFLESPGGFPLLGSSIPTPPLAIGFLICL